LFFVLSGFFVSNYISTIPKLSST